MLSKTFQCIVLISLRYYVGRFSLYGWRFGDYAKEIWNVSHTSEIVHSKFEQEIKHGGVSFCTVCSGIMQWHNAAHYSSVSSHMLITYFVIEDTMAWCRNPEHCNLHTNSYRIWKWKTSKMFYESFRSFLYTFGFDIIVWHDFVCSKCCCTFTVLILTGKCFEECYNAMIVTGRTVFKRYSCTRQPCNVQHLLSYNPYLM